MRIWMAFLLLGVAVTGGACANPDFWEHDSLYASGDHLLFSVRNTGRKPAPRVTKKDVTEAKTHSWWGRPVEVDADQVR